jgi:hypothetical protein
MHLLIDDGRMVGAHRLGVRRPSVAGVRRRHVGGVRGRRPVRHSDVVRRGHAWVIDPDAAAAGWVPAVAVDWAHEKLGWKNRALPTQQRRCVDVIARYAGA